MQADRNDTGKDTMAYHWILKKNNTMGETCGAGTDYTVPTMYMY
jgi:hypothetical protein